MAHLMLMMVYPMGRQVEGLPHMRAICVLAVVERHHLNWAYYAFVFVITL